MSKLFLRASIFAAMALFAQAVNADGFKVRGGVASTNYELDFDTSGFSGKGTSKYNATNLGLTYATPDGVYFDLSVSSGSGTHDLNTTPDTFKRGDLQFIVGMPVLSASSIYVGYKKGTTDLSCSSCIGYTKDTFTAKGLILGGGTGFPLGEDGSSGTIGVNAGIGLMKASWKDDGGFSVDADTAAGFSFGASYTYPITSSFGVTADYKFNSYSYDFTSSFGSSLKIDEKITALGASLYAKF